MHAHSNENGLLWMGWMDKKINNQLLSYNSKRSDKKSSKNTHTQERETGEIIPIDGRRQRE
jgi:hypothetical protein